jgi:hypothetical protein
MATAIQGNLESAGRYWQYIIFVRVSHFISLLLGNEHHRPGYLRNKISDSATLVLKLPVTAHHYLSVWL